MAGAVRLFLGFRATTRSLLFAPYIFTFMTAVRGLTPLQYGQLQLIYYWTVTLLEVPSGAVADRLGRRGALVVGAVVNGLGCFLFAVSHDFWTFVGGELLFAAGTAMISGADSAWLYDSLAEERRESEYVRAEQGGQFVWLAASAVGMVLSDLLLVRRGDPVLAYWVTGALSLAGALIACRMREPPVARRATLREITVRAAGDVVRIPGVLRFIAYSVGVFILLRTSIVSFFNPALDGMGVPVRNYGTVLAAVNVAGAIAALYTGRLLRRHGERAVLFALPVAMVSMYALLLPARTPLSSTLFCVQGAVFGAYPIVARSILNRLAASPERRATVLSIESMLCRVACGLVVLLAGWLLGSTDLPTAMAVTAAVGCLPFLLVPLLRKGAPA